jgi:hypothetical protein
MLNIVWHVHGCHLLIYYVWYHMFNRSSNFFNSQATADSSTAVAGARLPSNGRPQIDQLMMSCQHHYLLISLPLPHTMMLVLMMMMMIVVMMTWFVIE